MTTRAGRWLILLQARVSFQRATLRVKQLILGNFHTPDLEDFGHVGRPGLGWIRCPCTVIHLSGAHGNAGGHIQSRTLEFPAGFALENRSLPRHLETIMLTTIDLPEELLRQAEAEAMRRGVDVQALLQEGLRTVLQQSPSRETTNQADTPPWFGQLRRYAVNAGVKHDMAAIRASIDRERES